MVDIEKIGHLTQCNANQLIDMDAEGTGDVRFTTTIQILYEKENRVLTDHIVPVILNAVICRYFLWVMDYLTTILFMRSLCWKKVNLTYQQDMLPFYIKPKVLFNIKRSFTKHEKI